MNPVDASPSSDKALLHGSRPDAPVTLPRLAVLGWREWLALPGLGIPAIKAKLDTGARTSALHVEGMETFRQGGDLMVRFWLKPLKRRPSPMLTCTAPVSDRRFVSDSGGHRTKRYFILTDIVLANVTVRAEISLTTRHGMLFRMLLGRTAMAGGIVVDPAASYKAGKTLRDAYAKADRDGI